ncbi:MAG: O-antigen ligase family protein [Salibacteraceae bacterium]
MTEQAVHTWLKRIAFWMVVLLLLKIGGYFTVSENITITRGVKILLRMGATGGAFLLYRQLQIRGLSFPIHVRAVWPMLLYGVYLFLGVASLLWSTNPGYSLLQWFMTSESLVFVWVYLKTILVIRHHYPESPIRLSRMLGKAIHGIVLIFIGGWIIAPDDFYRLTHGGEVARLGGYFMNPNELGMMAVVGLAASALELARKSKPGLWFQVLAAGLVLVLTGSRSSMIAALLVVSLVAQNHLSNRMKVVIYGAMIVSIPFIIQLIFIKAGDLEEVMSMTGRLPFWKALLTEGLPKEPWLGFGFMRIAYTEAFQSVHTYAGKMTHNTFIQVLMNLGWIGFVIAISQLATAMVAGLRQSLRPHRLLFAAVMIPLLINSFTEFGIFGETNFGILFYQLIFFFPVMQLRTQLDRKAALKQRIAHQRWTKQLKHA